LAGIIERDGVRVAESRYLSDLRAGVDIDHLNGMAVRNIETPRRGIKGEVIPIPRAADGPGFLDEERIAGKRG